jgi:hypothetical protein
LGSTPRESRVIQLASRRTSARQQIGRPNSPPGG